MTDIAQKMKQHSVSVDEGSGVLINPSYGEFSYIITAKHNIRINEDEYKNAKDIKVKNSSNTIITVERVIIHSALDLAVLITQSRLELNLTSVNYPLTRGENVYFYGFPRVRRTNDENSPYEAREYRGMTQESGDQEFKLRLEGSPDKSQIDGASGGGIFKVDQENDVFLCGIESRMEGNNREHHGQVVCIHLNQLDSLLHENELPAIYPELMHNFYNLVCKTFSYFEEADDPEAVQFLKNKLHEHAEVFSGAGPRPIDIYNKLKEKLLIKNSSSQELYHEKLWVAFLEFMVISSLLDEVKELSFEYVDNTSKKRKFLFSASKGKWIRKLEDIFKSDFRGLEKGGVIVVSSNEPHANLSPKPRVYQNIIVHIGKISRSELMVDIGIRNPANDFRLCHLTGLHKTCVIEHEEKFADYYAGREGYDEEEMMSKFKESYREHI